MSGGAWAANLVRRRSLKPCKCGREMLVRWPCWAPRWYETVTRPSGNDVKVEVEDVLPSRWSVRLHQVEPVRGDALRITIRL
jgi:hypothetical protein